jgi:3-phosphoshikimate 1-carboxyvinyltransferase
MTLWCLKKFGINVKSEWDRFVVRRQRYLPAKFKVEGDWSSASYFLALGALSEEGVQVDNLKSASLQGDRVILDFIRNMGATVRMVGDSLIISKNNLKGIQADLSDCIDLLPTMAVLAALAEGESTFIGIARARIKESNRVAALKEGLKKFGVTVSDTEEQITIRGLRSPKKSSDDDSETTGTKNANELWSEDSGPVTIDSYGDHRIAMAFAIMGMALRDITIEGAESVAKTYPEFWEALASVGGKIKKDV